MTICTHNRVKLFGEIGDGQMILNELGVIVQDAWQSIAEKRSNVSLDAAVVMPNHLHGIVLLGGNGATDTPSVVSGEVPQSAVTLPSGSLGAIIGQFKGIVTKRSKLLSMPNEPRMWQRNYYEHIIRNEKSFNEIRSYICENPARWSEDALYVE